MGTTTSSATRFAERMVQDRREHPGWHGLAIRGFLEDSSALFGVLAEIEALGLEFARAPSDPDRTEITVMR